jgi:hypothetical protein
MAGKFRRSWTNFFHPEQRKESKTMSCVDTFFEKMLLRGDYDLVPDSFLISTGRTGLVEQKRRERGRRCGPDLEHDDTTQAHEPAWGEVDQEKLPRVAFADQGDAGDPSTWLFAHHHVTGGTVDSSTGRYTSGTLWLNRAGLDHAWSAALGLRSGAGGQPKAPQKVLDHLREHRQALGLESDATNPQGRAADPEYAWKTAVHEAAHATVLYLYGAEIDFATVVPDPVGGTDGRVVYSDGRMDDLAGCMSAVAGFQAVRQLVDIQDLMPMNDVDYNLAMSYLADYPQSERSRRLGDCKMDVCDLLKRLEGRFGMGHVSELAKELYARRRMSGREITAFFQARGLRPER